MLIISLPSGADFLCSVQCFWKCLFTVGSLHSVCRPATNQTMACSCGNSTSMPDILQMNGSFPTSVSSAPPSTVALGSSPAEQSTVAESGSPAEPSTVALDNSSVGPTTLLGQASSNGSPTANQVPSAGSSPVDAAKSNIPTVNADGSQQSTNLNGTEQPSSG